MSSTDEIRSPSQPNQSNSVWTSDRSKVHDKIQARTSLRIYLQSKPPNEVLSLIFMILRPVWVLARWSSINVFDLQPTFTSRFDLVWRWVSWIVICCDGGCGDDWEVYSIGLAEVGHQSDWSWRFSSKWCFFRLLRTTYCTYLHKALPNCTVDPVFKTWLYVLKFEM